MLPLTKCQANFNKRYQTMYSGYNNEVQLSYSGYSVCVCLCAPLVCT